MGPAHCQPSLVLSHNSGNFVIPRCEDVLYQYHPGTFGGSSVHSSARGRAFHAATAASLVVLMGPLNAHFTCWHMTNAQPVPFALAIPAGCPHAGHGNGSNVSSSGILTSLLFPQRPDPNMRSFYWRPYKGTFLQHFGSFYNRN